MSKHTPEPWRVYHTWEDEYEDNKRYVSIEGNSHFHNDDDIAAECSGWEEHVEANAARIVACVNALADYPNPAAVRECIEALRRLTRDPLDRSAALHASAALAALENPQEPNDG